MLEWLSCKPLSRRTLGVAARDCRRGANNRFRVAILWVCGLRLCYRGANLRYRGARLYRGVLRYRGVN